MEQDEQLKLLQKILFEMLCDITDLCEKNNIKYSLEAGTLLGAIRHKNFIPWDDDVDISMQRSEYERFLKVCQTELDKEKYSILNNNNNKKFCFSFTKILLNNTLMLEDFSKNVNIPHCIFLDVFPFDNVPDNSKKQNRFFKKNKILKNIIWIKLGYGTDRHKKKLSYKLIHLISKFIPIALLNKKRYKLITKYNKTSTKMAFISDYPQQKIYNIAFDSYSKYEFNHLFFNGYAEYDSYLKSYYGNYLELPPIEERFCHSNYKIDFGKYGQNNYNN